MTDNLKKTDIFLNNTEVCFLTTVAGDMPKCRPIAFHIMREGKIFFMVSNHKDVYYQMKRFPSIEIVALSGQTWMRYFGTAVFEKDHAMIKAILRAVPELKADYGDNAEDVLELFHLENATVEMRRMSTLTDRYELNVTDVKSVSRHILVEMDAMQPDKLLERFKRGHFPAHFQQLVALDTKKPTGVEALARLIDDEGRLHEADEFIPLLEDARLIHLLDYHIFEEICKAQRERLDLGMTILPMSSNFSGLTMIREDFVDTLIKISARYKLPHQIMVVEVAESPSEEAFAVLQRTAGRLSKAGFKVAIDDFGVKTTNLQLLTEVDFQVLKVDKHIINSVHTQKKTQFLLAGLINVCHKLGIRVVAEGVEESAQAEILRDLHCDTAQGRLFGAPQGRMQDA